MVLPRHTPLGRIVEYEADCCFLASPNLVPRAGKSKSQSSWVKTTFRSLLAATAAYHITSSTRVEPEHQLPNRITIYGNKTGVTELNEVVNHYPSLWEDNGNVADVPEAEWMEIPLLDNWQELYKPGQAKVYPLGTKDCELVDQAFDKLHQQGCMTWTTQSTPFTYPCFVVWKTTPNGRKGWVVVNIRALNRITMPNAYPVPSQADILAAVQGAAYISTVDCASFFYQWRVKPQDSHKLTVSSHQGQETFQVAVMSYRNSPAYVQQMID